jgi:hypothetical protein
MNAAVDGGLGTLRAAHARQFQAGMVRTTTQSRAHLEAIRTGGAARVRPGR